MKKADDNYIWKLLDMCRYIKWRNISKEEFNKINNINQQGGKISGF